MLKPLLPTSNNRCGRWRDHRQVINGIIHRLSTGCQWRTLPERFGPWQTVQKRHQLWSADDTWERLLQHVQAVVDAAGGINWDINIDSTSIRAHQHAAGAPKEPPPSPPGISKGAARRSVHVHAHMRRNLSLEGVVLRARLSAVPAAALPRRFTWLRMAGAVRCHCCSRLDSERTVPSSSRSWTRSTCLGWGRGVLAGPRTASRPIRRTATARFAPRVMSFR